MDFVVISPECSALPIGLLVSFAVEGNSRFEKTLMAASTKAQQEPSSFSAKKYFPRGIDNVRSAFTDGRSSVCQSCCIALQNSARCTESANCVGTSLLVYSAL